MSIINKKINSFTILEVTVAMLLSSISIAIIYSAFNIIDKSYKNYDIRNKRFAELALGDKLLEKDFFDASKIKYTQSGLIMVKPDSSRITYEFAEGYILRNQNDLQMDSIYLKHDKPVYSFENDNITREGLIDKINLVFIIEDRKVNRIYCKHYSAVNLFE